MSAQIKLTLSLGGSAKAEVYNVNGQTASIEVDEILKAADVIRATKVSSSLVGEGAIGGLLDTARKVFGDRITLNV